MQCEALGNVLESHRTDIPAFESLYKRQPSPGVKGSTELREVPTPGKALPSMGTGVTVLLRVESLQTCSIERVHGTVTALCFRTALSLDGRSDASAAEDLSPKTRLIT